MRSHTRIKMVVIAQYSHNDISANGIEILPESKDQNKQFAVGHFCPWACCNGRRWSNARGEPWRSWRYLRVQEMIWVNYTTLMTFKRNPPFFVTKTTCHLGFFFGLVNCPPHPNRETIGRCCILARQLGISFETWKGAKGPDVGGVWLCELPIVEVWVGCTVEKVVFLARYSFLHLDVLTSFKRRIN